MKKILRISAIILMIISIVLSITTVKIAPYYETGVFVTGLAVSFLLLLIGGIIIICTIDESNL